MINLIRDGGMAMWLLLVLGAVGVVLGVRFALTPDGRRLAMVRALSWALVFASVAGLAAGVRKTAWAINTFEELAQTPGLTLMTGVGEAMAVPTLGFGLLMLIWVLVAVGLRKAPHSALE